MGSFGNYVGATMGTSTNEEGRSGSVYDNSWVTNSNYPQRAALLDSNDGDGDGNKNEFVHVDDVDAEDDPNAHTPRSELLRQEQGVLPDPTYGNKVRDQLTGGSALNWETFTYVELREEKDALNPSAIGVLSTAWKTHGETLKTKSEEFKESVRNAITGRWEGESAEAAETATQEVTRTSIYEFTPASEALANRLTALQEAFDHIKTQFPGTSLGDLIEDGNFDKTILNNAIDSFNSRYHLDGGGRLRNNSDGYVTAADALRELEEINRSIRDYERAVQLFRDTYNPTVQAVMLNFPQLPPPPSGQYGQNGPGPGGGTGTGTGTGTGLGSGGVGGGTGGGTPAFDKPSFGKTGTGTPAFSTADIGADTTIPEVDLGTGDQKTPPISPVDTPTDSPAQTVAQGLGQGLNAATQGLNSGLGAASQAAKAGQGAAGTGQRPIPALREGALGLGDKPGAKAGGGAGGARSGGGAGGVGGLGANEPAARLASQSPTSSAGARVGMPTASAGMAGAGMPGAGAPMGGAPAGGQRGGDGKEHKGNKALRSRRNGNDIVGDTDAVVPVLGGEPAPQTEDNQPAPPRRRIPQQGISWQPDSAVQGGSRRSPQPSQPGSTPADQLADQ